MEAKDKKSKKENKQNTEDSDKKKADDKKGKKKDTKGEVTLSAPFTNCRVKTSFRCYRCAVKRLMNTVCFVTSVM